MKYTLTPRLDSCSLVQGGFDVRGMLTPILCPSLPLCAPHYRKAMTQNLTTKARLA
jgi:hypothetical protein